MFKILKRNLTTKTSIKYLGRWSVDKPIEAINKNIDWSNHDHCGSDLCNLMNLNQEKKNYDFDTLELLYINKEKVNE